MMGINPAVKPGVIALNESRFIYACGNNIVLHDTMEKS
jgi:hypothetical protein